MRTSHVYWNIVGLGIPLIIAAISVPHLLINLGNERFGALGLAWGLIGYASALDMGIGRAATQRISGLIGSNEIEQIPDVAATATRLTSVLGAIGMVMIFSVNLLDVKYLLGAKEIPVTEITNSIFLLGLALPLQSLSATYRGINEAYLNFQKISYLRMALGMANFGGPYIISFHSNRIDLLVISLVISRFVALFFFRKFSLACIKKNTIAIGKFKKQVSKQLFEFGNWYVISSTLSPLLTQTDRFFIANIINTSAVASYVIPYELTTQILIISGAITTAAFPSISQNIKINVPQAKKIFTMWLQRLFLIITLASLFIAIIIPDILKLWLKTIPTQESISVGRILCVGVIANAIGSMYFSLLHAKGNTKSTAKLHMIELLIYIPMLVWLIKCYGITGAAMAWSMRMIGDAIALKWLTTTKYTN